jgi:hypothetical protein
MREEPDEEPEKSLAVQAYEAVGEMLKEANDTMASGLKPKPKSKPLKIPNITIAMDEEKAPPETKTEEDEPEYGSWEWTPFIMSKLLPGIESVEDKKGQKYPKCMGLKRLLEKYVGPILDVQNQVLVTPNRDNHGIYVVQVTVKVLVNNKTHPTYGMIVNPATGEIEPMVIEWSDVSQTWANDEGQSAIVTQNPIASCSTKALSRCLRSLLGLSGVYTSEEMTDVGKPLKSHDPDSRPSMENLSGDIKPSQIRFITNICDKYEVDILKVIRDILQDDHIESLNEISAQEGKKVQIAVNELQAKSPPGKWKK